MKLKISRAITVAAAIVCSAAAQDLKPVPKPPEPPDKEKLSYALGMSLGQQIKQAGVDADVPVIQQAIQDVLAGRPTEIQAAEIRSILKSAEAEAHLKQTSKNIARGEAFLAENAKRPDITVLPDGLQYRVIKSGAGQLPQKIDVLTLKFRGTWIDGTEFRHNDNLEIPFLGCTKGLQEALRLMKVGSEWQVFVPYNLAYGRLGDRAAGFGSTLIYDLELVSTEPESDHKPHHSSGQAGHSLDEELLPANFQAHKAATMIQTAP